MNFGIEDDDPDFGLTPGARSRLSSLFQSQEPTDEDPNQALTYTAPKQPKKQDQQQTSAAGQFKLIHAVAVHTYILEGGKYSSQGQAGAAVLGNHETSEYKLLLYKGKQQKITCGTINANFSYRVQENNYANFYDDRKVNWSVMFDSEKSSTEFAKQVALAKANSCGSNLNSTIIQDLTAGEGTVVLENGGSADVHYVSWIFANHKLGNVVDSNMDSEKPFRFRMGKTKVIKGWSGLSGSKKGMKRLVIIPPAFAYGSEGVPDKVPPNAVVVYEFLIKKVKEPKESSSLSQSPARSEGELLDKKPEISPKPHSQSITDETIRMRGASISEQLMQSPKKGNATIISRMAKMGTATLPLPGGLAAQASSESEAEDECYSKSDSPTPPVPAARSRESSPKPVPKPRSSSGSSIVTQSVHPMPTHGIAQTQISHVVTSSQLPVYATASVPSHQHLVSDTFPLHVYPQATSHTAYPIMQSAYAPHHPLPAISPTVVPSMADSHLTLLLTETRSQNTEVRLSLSKISDKVETVLQKVEDIRSQDGSRSHNSHHYMESNALVQNIQRIVQENTRLKEDVEAKNSKIQSLNEKICEVLQKNQRFFEESNTYLEQRTESSLTQSRILSLEQEKSKLMSEVNDALSKATELQTNLDSFKKTENELSEKLRTSHDENKKQQELVDSLRKQCSEKENHLLSLQKNLQQVEQEKRDLLQKIQYLEQKVNELELIRRTLEKTVMEKEAENKELQDRLENQIKNVRDTSEVKESPISEEELKLILQDKEKLQHRMKEIQNRYTLVCEKSAQQKERFDDQITEMKSRMRHLISQASKAQSSPSAPSSESDFDIKKTMNALYRLLQSQIQLSESYGGEEVLKICLETIRGLTVRVLTEKQKVQPAAPQLENSDESVSHSVTPASQKPGSATVGASPPKSSNSLDLRSSEDQRSESLSVASSPPKLDTPVASSAENDNQQVSKGTGPLGSMEQTLPSTGNSLLYGTKEEEASTDSHCDPASSELTTEKDDGKEHENLQFRDSPQNQEEKKEELEEKKLVLSQIQMENKEVKPKSELQITSEGVLENGEDQKMLDVQENIDDRKTPDQKSDALFIPEHTMEADDALKTSDLVNGPLKVL